MATIITADTFDRWWAALDERSRHEADTSRSERSPAGVQLNPKVALSQLESCTETQRHLFHDGLDSNDQNIRRVVALSDTVTLEGDDEFVEELIRNIVALTGIEPEYADEPVPGNDIEPMVERMREVREGRDK
jgi:hypothetical protein